MPGLGPPTPDQTSVATPYRLTTVTFDESWPGVGQPPQSEQRNGHEINPIPPHELLLQLSTGAWTMKPNEMRTNSVTQGAGGTILRPGSGLTVASTVQERTLNHAPSDQSGAMDGAGSNLASLGNYMLRRSVADGGSWHDSSLAADFTALPSPESNTDYALDRLAVGTVTYGADQGFMLRWKVPGAQASAPDVSHTFYMGGPQFSSGGGEFALSVRGDGMAILYCHMTNAAGTGLQWYEVDRWRYADPGKTGDVFHSMAVIPHTTGLGNGIEFRSGLADVATNIGNAVNGYTPREAKPGTSHFSLMRLLYVMAVQGVTQSVLQRVYSDIHHLGSATGPGPVRLDGARNSRGLFQISTASYPASAVLTDRPFALRWFPTVTTPLIVYAETSLPAGTSITVTVYNGDTATALAPASVPGLPAGAQAFVPVPSASGYYVSFLLQSSPDRTRAPILASYKITRDGSILQPAPGEWSGGTVQGVNITGPENDPSHESASVQIQDLTDTLATLRTGGEIPIRVDTQYDSTDTTKRSTLFRGRTLKALATKPGGMTKEGLGGGGAARAYPVSSWRHYEIDAAGMWYQLDTQFTLLRQSLLVGGQPMKVTDLVRAAFGWCGFPSSMISVPDASMQFWLPPGDNTYSLILNPLQKIAQFIVKAVRDYLGWYVLWDNNAGPLLTNGCSQGMWRVLAPPAPPYTPLASFVEGPATAGAVPHVPASYPAGTTWIPAGSWHTWVDPPEFNAILVRGTGPGGTGALSAVEQWWVNTNSYTFDPAKPANSNRAVNPDYLGYFKPACFGDAAISGQASVDWMCERLMNVAGHAVKNAVIDRVPMLLVTDPNDSLQTRPRPLRYYDPVNVTVDGVTGTYLVRNFNPSYTVDGWQFGRLELMSPPQDYQTAGSLWVP